MGAIGDRNEEGAAAQAHTIGESVMTVMTIVAVMISVVVVAAAAVDGGVGAVGMKGMTMGEGVGMEAALRGGQEAL